MASFTPAIHGVVYPLTYWEVPPLTPL
ncbi:hypothetical protein E2C01_075854 [Portunus trituberculatus]|uniref:Uncharacterized protein n=1 Tax=Portunus trituberculatus TaxID=210409 RepID=A0A5B7II62_PORTR|nr:hypothetical protein [Portunus trituberculatus]